MERRSVKHPHYVGPKKYEVLAKTAVEKLVEHHYNRGVRTPPPGQYLILHRVKGGEYYIPLFIHVIKGYSGPEAYVHPLPLDKATAETLRRKGVHTPYGILALDTLERILSSESHVTPGTFAESLILDRIATRRARRQYPPLPEYEDPYVANKLLQEVAPESETYRLRKGSVFVLDYHVHNDRSEAKIVPFDPERHASSTLKTVWPDNFRPVAHFFSDVFREIINRVSRRGRQARL